MSKSETTISAAKARAPRGSKPVKDAFFTALNAVPEANRAAVAKAAQAMIRDEIKTQRERMKLATAKQKARKPAAAKRTGKATMATTDMPAEQAAATKRRTRKQTEMPVSA